MKPVSERILRCGETEHVAPVRSTATSPRRLPAYARQFHPDRNGDAIVCIGWPPVLPPAPNVVVLPPGIPPDVIDWRCLRGCRVVVMPRPPEGRADRNLLRAIGAELAAAGVREVILSEARGGSYMVLADPVR